MLLKGGRHEMRGVFVWTISSYEDLEGFELKKVEKGRREADGFLGKDEM